MKEKEYRVLVTEEFLKEYSKLSIGEQKRLDKIKEQLKTNPFSGKPIGYHFFREKKIEEKRLYYLIY